MSKVGESTASGTDRPESLPAPDGADVEGAEPAEQGAPPTGSGSTGWSRTVTVAVWVIVGVSIVTGTALRLWWLFHRPTNSDESIAGLMAHQITQGHTSAFYWGQSYGGVEPYLIAVRFAVFGFSTFLLPLVATLLAVGSGLLTWRVARRLVTDPTLAVLAGALAWAVPAFAMGTSSYEWGFRGVALFCGLLILLLSLRLRDGHRRPWDFAELGLTLGVGWWSSPEIVYFLLPCLILVVQSYLADEEGGRVSRWLGGVLVAVVAACLGALPWLWANVQSGFASLNRNAYLVPAGSPDFVGRLRLFFHYSVGMLLSLRANQSGSWLFLRPLSVALEVLFAALVLASVVLCVRRGGRQLAIASGIVVFPFLLAFSPASWFWEDGRYVSYAVPYLVLVLIMGGAEVARLLNPGRRQRGERATMVGRVLNGGVGAVLVGLAVANFAVFTIPNVSFFEGWGNPDAPTLSALSRLEAAGVHDGYADYWVAYRLDFLSEDKVGLTVIGADPDRWPTLNREVEDSKRQAWIFVPTTPASFAQFSGSPQAVGPGGVTQAQFTADLHHLGIGYRTVTTGLINAVIPDRAVLPRQIGVPDSG